ncbi:hypothetical protein ACSBR1_026700 [Camellia fascicularis]
MKIDKVQKRLLEFILAAFHRSLDFVALLKKPIIDRLGEAYDSPCKGRQSWPYNCVGPLGSTEGVVKSHKDAAGKLFESLELLLYENLSSIQVHISKKGKKKKK